MMGEKNKQKLASTFLRPTNWKDYCLHVSNNNCSVDDGAAIRAPRDESEENMHFLQSIYRGHFRATEKNNCTGHIVDVPCGWTTYVSQQAYHLDIAV